MSQSPIRLHAVDALPLLQPLRLFECKYKSEMIKGCFEGEPGHANFVVEGPGPQVRFRNALYELKKIHIHSESEHLVGHDVADDLELHLVHAPLGSTVASPLVAIGILFTEADKSEKSSKTGAAIRELLTSVQKRVCISIDPLELFPRVKGKVDKTEWFHYEGSLTSYPYSENVSWIVMRNAATIPGSLIKDIKEHAEQHPRALQPLDRRLVVRSFVDKAEKG